MGVWGTQWIQTEVSQDDLDARLLVWDMRIEEDQLPTNEIVVHIHFTDVPEEDQNYWLVLQEDSVDLCLKDPGREDDLIVRSDVETLAKVWLGDIGLRRAFSENTVRVSGRPDLRDQFPEWLGLNRFAKFGRKRSH